MILIVTTKTALRTLLLSQIGCPMRTLSSVFKMRHVDSVQSHVPMHLETLWEEIQNMILKSLVITSSACVGGLSFSHIALYSLKLISDLNFSPVASPYHVPDMFGKKKKVVVESFGYSKKATKKGGLTKMEYQPGNLKLQLVRPGLD